MSTSGQRLVAATLLFLFLGGPTPGAVGSCDEQRRYVRLVPYCEEREQLVCWRRHLRGELDESDETVDECRVNAIEQCQNRFWPPDCRPTERQARACINALRSYDTLQTPESEIRECSPEALCTVKTEPPSWALPDAGMQ